MILLNFLTNTNKFDIFSIISKDIANFNIMNLITSMGVALITALFIYFIYKFTYTGVTFNRAFGLTIIITTLVTSIIMMIIGSNLALSLGMVGALSIIRFRNAVKESRDISFIFWAVTSGLAAGVGIYTLCVLGSLFIGITVIVFNLTNVNSKNYLLILKIEDECDQDSLNETINSFVKRYRLRMKNYSNGLTELIYELNPLKGKEGEIVSAISLNKNVKSINLVSSNEDM